MSDRSGIHAGATMGRAETGENDAKRSPSMKGKLGLGLRADSAETRVTKVQASSCTAR